MENTIPQNQIKKPNKKWFWIIAGFFLVYLAWGIFSNLSNKDERLCIYEIPASVEWQIEHSNKSLIERDITLWKYQVAVKEYGLTYLGEGTDSNLEGFINFEVNYCDLSERRNITIPFNKQLIS